MHAADADDLFPLRGQDGDAPVAGQGLLILGDLVAFGQVGVEVVLAGKDADRRDLALQRQRHAQAVLDRLLVEHRQRARHARAHRADGGVGRGLGGVHQRAGAEHLGLRLKLGVDFQSDDGFVSHGSLPPSHQDTKNR